MWNRLPALMADTDATVLHDFKDTLLNRKVVERALDQAEAIVGPNDCGSPNSLNVRSKTVKANFSCFVSSASHVGSSDWRSR